METNLVEAVRYSAWIVNSRKFITFNFISKYTPHANLGFGIRFVCIVLLRHHPFFIDGTGDH